MVEEYSINDQSSRDNCSNTCQQVNIRTTPTLSQVFVLYVVVRRELVKEKLREKLELERRALQIVERLLEDSVTEDFLTDCVCII